MPWAQQFCSIALKYIRIVLLLIYVVVISNIVIAVIVVIIIRVGGGIWEGMLEMYYCVGKYEVERWALHCDRDCAWCLTEMIKDWDPEVKSSMCTSVCEHKTVIILSDVQTDNLSLLFYTRLCRSRVGRWNHSLCASRARKVVSVATWWENVLTSPHAQWSPPTPTCPSTRWGCHAPSHTTSPTQRLWHHSTFTGEWYLFQCGRSSYLNFV